jgi:hypothetical protein
VFSGDLCSGVNSCRQEMTVTTCTLRIRIRVWVKTLTLILSVQRCLFHVH